MPPPRVIGQYELHTELAAGGMATVYLGRRKSSDRIVAIKRLHEHLARDPELPSVLLEEGRISKRITHPNVVATLDVVRGEGENEQELLLVMEYVHGETVAKLLRAAQVRGTRCPVPIAAAIIHGVLLGLEAAHNTRDEAGRSLEIVHRDVSPQNIIVSADDGVARILDFGIAKAVGTQIHTRTGELKGKIPYMAPEILAFEKATPKSDVWAAAVVLWELLCSKRLFKGESEVHVWGQVLNGPIPSVEETTGEPSVLDAVLRRALSRDRAAGGGYSTAGELAQAITSATRLALPSEVREWLLIVAKDSLEQRLTAVSSFEATLKMKVTPPPPPQVTTLPLNTAVKAVEPEMDTSSPSVRSIPVVGAKPRPRGLILGAATIVAATLVGVSLWQYRARVDHASAATPPTTTTPTTTMTSSAASSPPAPVESNTSAAPLAVVASASAPPSLPARKTAPIKPLRAKPAAGPSSCDPPYVIDSAGRKIFKLECVSKESQ